MASRYWVPGGTGNWSSTTNWSATTGGASGASVPTNADDVFINANSGTSSVITVDAVSNCLSLDFTGAITPTFAGGSFTLFVYGNLTLISTMSYTRTGNLVFAATTTGKTITTAGKTLTSASVVFNGVGGAWTQLDALNIGTNQIDFRAGTWNTGNFAVALGVFTMLSSSAGQTINLGSSILTLSGNWSGLASAATLNAGTSTIIMAGNSSAFTGAGLTYYNVTLTGNPVRIDSSNTFSTLTFTAGKTVNITSSTTQTYTNLVANGTPSSKITIQTVTSGSAATLSKASGVSAIRNIALKDITATGGATFYALGTTNVSGNTGWSYQMLIKQEKLSGSLMSLYHIDSAGTMTKVSG